MKNINNHLLNILESAIKEVYPDPNKQDTNTDGEEPNDSSNLDAPADDQNQTGGDSPMDDLEGSNGAPSDPNNPTGDDSGLDGMEGGSGDIGDLGGGGGFGGGGGGLGDIDSGQQPSEEDTGIDTIEDDSTEDPVKAIVDKVKDLANKTSDELMILKYLKAGVQQRFPNPKDAQMVINQLKQSGNATLANSADRLQSFLLLKQERKNVMKNKKKTLENLNENELRAVIKRFIDKKFNKLVTEGEMSQIMAGMPSVSQKSSAGNSTFDAERSLGIKAKTLGLEFEKDMIKELDLIAPNQMDGNSQKIYKETMDNFHDKFVAAVVDAVNAIKILPKNEHEEQKA